jgi:hypothetical protein
LLAFVLAACSGDRPTTKAEHSSQRRDDSQPSTSPPKITSSTAVIAADGCTGREMHDCARTKGCLLDQPTSNTPLCRPADGPCESAVRHADLIGRDADPAVTTEIVAAAEKACAANPVCAVTSGRCSCPCAILGSCKCDCGGGYLQRCTFKSEVVRFNGRPPHEMGDGPLGDIGRGLVAVARAPHGRAFKVDPLPAPDSLVGMTRQAIEGTLGTGTTCTDLTTAPCKALGQVFYSLYKLDKGALGGGPELLLTYDASSKCSDAKITFTR